jgi:hypothetical protein
MCAETACSVLQLPLLLCCCVLQVAGCGYGVTCHVRTFLHGCSRITLSIATLPSSDALPGEERGQVRNGAKPLLIQIN